MKEGIPSGSAICQAMTAPQIGGVLDDGTVQEPVHHGLVDPVCPGLHGRKQAAASDDGGQFGRIDAGLRESVPNGLVAHEVLVADRGILLQFGGGMLH